MTPKGFRVTTARTPEDVRDWVESTQHHRGDSVSEEHHMVLCGYGAKLRVPHRLWREVADKLVPGHHLDARLYRWVDSPDPSVRLQKIALDLRHIASALPDAGTRQLLDASTEELETVLTSLRGAA